MTAKQYLSQLRTLDTKINQMQEELYMLRCAAERTTPAQDTFSGGGGSDRVGNISARMGDLDVEINERIDELVDLRHMIIGQIHELDDDRYLKILYKRYVEYKSLEEIGEELHYSYDWTRHMHAGALRAFADKHTTTHQNTRGCANMILDEMQDWVH